MPSSRNHCCKPHYHPPGATHSFEGISPLWPFFLGKQSSYSFVLHPRLLSLRFYSVPGYRGRILATKLLNSKNEGMSMCCSERLLLPTTPSELQGVRPPEPFPAMKQTCTSFKNLSPCQGPSQSCASSVCFLRTRLFPIPGPR